MSLTLILTRHAKSSWASPELDDFDRPLNDRGHRSAAALGAWLSEHEIVPGEVIVSSARRTVDTWTGIAEVLRGDSVMRSEPALYLASAPSIRAVLRGANAQSVMLICHNPGIGEFATRILDEAPDDMRFVEYPTGATTVATFDLDRWSDVDYGTGRLAHFVVPRDLTG